MVNHLGKTRFGALWLGKCAAVPLAMLLVGCAPEGTGTIKVDSQAVRAKAEGAAASTPANQKQAAALKAEQEAAKKNPKLR